jgi:hypothetical protein
LDRRLGGLQNRSAHGDEEKNSQPLPGLEPPIIQPVAQRSTTEKSIRASYIASNGRMILKDEIGMLWKEVVEAYFFYGAVLECARSN